MTVNNKEQGTVTAYVADKGFGFISQGATPKDYKRFWFHITSFAGNNGTKPAVGTQVTFSVKPLQEGPNKTAIDVWPL
jgi:cold shock CspA family protein